jgi:serine/threonine protein phosphatase 1
MNKRLFAIGDIHGCFDSLKELIETKIKLQKNDRLILLGDYIDRGDKSKELVDYIMELQVKDYDIVPLMGNHEVMLLEAYENEKNTSKWIQNGGSETLKSFEISSLKSIDVKYIEFFKKLKYYHSFEDFIFVHAGFNDNLVNPFTDYYSMLWKCKESYTNPLLVNNTIIHGHCTISTTICDERVKKGEKVINLDTGCVYKTKEGKGRLTAYECTTRRILFV